MSERSVKVMIGVDGCIPTVEEFRAEFPNVTFCVAATPEAQIEQIGDVEVCIGRLSREAFLAARKLRWVQSPWAGIDFAMASPELVESDVIVTNVLGPHAEPMADHVFAMILAFAHCLPAAWESQKQHRWDARKYYGKMLDLHGRTIGILGFGGVGRAVARRARGFGMKIYAVDLAPDTAGDEADEVWPPQRLDDLLRISDWFVVAAPLTDRTRGLIDRRRIGLLKPTAHVIVISRGAIVDEEALAEALREGRIAGAGADCLATEPPDPDSPSELWALDNVLLTPHLSSASPDMFTGRRQACKENLRRYLAGQPLRCVRDKKAGF